MTPLSLSARIGETMEEIRKRHGNGKELNSQLLLTIDHYDVTISFEKNRSVMEIYTPRTTAPDEPPRKLESEEIKKLLELNGEGKSWQKLSYHPDSSRTTWRRADGKLFARYFEKENNLTFLPSLSSESK